MQTQLSSEFRGTPDGEEAEAILRKCVHCGFCTATCPTYQLLGDELDGPRGRIYLIKQVLEGDQPTRETQVHLDRCLTCRNCETTCPSGVEYGHLLDIGRRLVDERVKRPLGEQAIRWVLKEGLPSPAFGPLLKIGQSVRQVLPATLKAKIPQKSVERFGRRPFSSHARKVLLLEGCVQPSMMPSIHAATVGVLDAMGIQSLVSASAGCCGAIRMHMGDRDGALMHMRNNIDAWWPIIEQQQVEAIIVNASGCTVSVKDYGHALRTDSDYAARAAKISALTKDLSELLPEMAQVLKPLVKVRTPSRLAFHPPCTLQHGQKIRNVVESSLADFGFDVQMAASESHLCCGSAGTYSVLNPGLATQLRDRKLGHLEHQKVDAIVSANIGCIQHLQSGTATPVRHWIEVVAEEIGLS